MVKMSKKFFNAKRYIYVAQFVKILEHYDLWYVRETVGMRGGGTRCLRLSKLVQAFLKTYNFSPCKPNSILTIKARVIRFFAPERGKMCLVFTIIKSYFKYC